MKYVQVSRMLWALELLTLHASSSSMQDAQSETKLAARHAVFVDDKFLSFTFTSAQSFLSDVDPKKISDTTLVVRLKSTFENDCTQLNSTRLARHK